MTAPALTASVEESSTEYRVTLTHPSRGSAVVVFRKGIDALGGSFGYAASGSPSPSPLMDGIQTQHITDEDGGFVVECPVIPGCISQGDTRDEALANIREAIELCLENQAAEGWQLPEHVEVTKIAV